ncbi:MAG: hypothetical protein M1827_007063 [Pycnora praestabilis]|nr:MAG: hypothetical protein M1827_007063 [Pycnora praestabilis]
MTMINERWVETSSDNDNELLPILLRRRSEANAVARQLSNENNQPASDLPEEIPDSQEEIITDTEASSALNEKFSTGSENEENQGGISSHNPVLDSQDVQGLFPEQNAKSFESVATEVIEGGTQITRKPGLRHPLHNSGFCVNGRLPEEDPRYKDFVDMEEEATQPSTQLVMDPRREGRNNSGLDDEGLSDVICILHPATPTAYKVVNLAAKSTPQHVLQNKDLSINWEEVEGAPSFDAIESFNGDIALRLSSRLKDVNMGFCFGRNPIRCDIVLGNAEYDKKKISNMHFRIWLNDQGILMLEDLSTNGTIVDGVILKGKDKTLAKPIATRMLDNTSVIEILSAKPDEMIKFIVRYPSRNDRSEYEYNQKLQDYLHHIRNLKTKVNGEWRGLPEARPNHNTGPIFQEVATPPVATPPAYYFPSASTRGNHGMVWSGGPLYNVVGYLGKGAFANVFTLATKDKGEKFAAKELQKRSLMRNGIMDLKIDNEMRIMKRLKHKNIVQYFDSVEQPEHIYIIMEYVGHGDLGGYMGRTGAISEALAKTMARQIFLALEYLHQSKITHRDIKPDNLLIASYDPFVVKLSDFGLSKVITHQTEMTTFCGTLLYCAPEIFPGYKGLIPRHFLKRPRLSDTDSPRPKTGPYNQSVDGWSFAAVLFHALSTKPPFEGIGNDQGQSMLRNIMTKPLNLAPLKRVGISKHGIDLIRSLLDIMPASRPTDRACLQHSWFDDFDKDNEMKLDLNPGLSKPEAEDGEEGDLDASQLSLHDKSDSQDIGDSDVEQEAINIPGLYDSEYRSTKRAKVEVDDKAQQQLEESELSYTSLPPNQFTHHLGAPRVLANNNRLFGEIGASALRSSGVFGHSNHFASAMPSYPNDLNGVQMNAPFNSGNNQRTTTDSTKARNAHVTISRSNHSQHASIEAGNPGPAPSLFGAESLVGHLNMVSPNLDPSAASTPITPGTPRTPDTREASPASSSKRSREDRNALNSQSTPKRGKIDRRINLLPPASAYWEASDPSTHTLEYATLVSGTDYVGEAATLRAFQAKSKGQEPTFDDSGVRHVETQDKENYGPSTTASTQDKARAEGLNASVDAGGKETGVEVVGDAGLGSNAPVAGSPDRQERFVQPPPRLGKLVSLPGSICDISIKLEQQEMSWGRNPTSTHVFPDSQDTRIPKNAFALSFWVPGMKKAIKDGKNWRRMKGVQPYLATDGKYYIAVNGVKLRSQSNGGRAFGKLYNGDIITVWQMGPEFLKFRCQFYHGLSAQPRPDGEKFVQEITVPGDEETASIEMEGREEEASGLADSASENPMGPST